MNQRYVRPIMNAVWTDQARFQAWLDVELAVCEVYTQQGLISPSEMEALRKASFSIDRINAIETETRHDVVAFTRAVSETLGPEKRWIHYGLTSTDVVDTANGLLFKQANAILSADLHALMEVLKAKALQYKTTLTIGRTHGIHAEITTFGLKYALWLDEFRRHANRFEAAAADVETGKISGAVGNCLTTGVDLQDAVCERLGLHIAKLSTQVLQRDRHAHYFSVLALIASSLEKIAVEFRHLQRTEVRETEEGFASGQKGSSAMPHKRNPISFENISGLSRLMRGYMISAFENIPLWHERDISHSSVERVIFPDATILMDYLLNRMTGLLKNLIVDEGRMLENIQQTHGVIFAQRVMNALIAKGHSREAAYDAVQPLAMTAWHQHTDFKSLLKASEIISQQLTPEELDSCFTLDYYVSTIDALYARIGL
jgi:adenylosuccinate lyase